ncbi:hypothetical protein_gp187 [Bacillus phage vB_BceM_WH1]|nr:hypothetical protein_gp187 [Bacillus phage vB_BceM_WH1]
MKKKKKKKPAIKLGRATWHIRPTTKVKESGKVYKRKSQNWQNEE